MFQPPLLLLQTSLNWLVNDQLAQHFFLKYFNNLLNVAKKNMERKIFYEKNYTDIAHYTKQSECRTKVELFKGIA